MPTFKQNKLGGLPFTTIPDYFLAEVMIKLSPSELRVMLYIFLHTLGYGKLADAISYDQFLGGMVTRDGRRLDYGAGVKRRALVDALYSLEHEHGLISRTHDGYSMLATIHLKLPSPQDAPVGAAQGINSIATTPAPFLEEPLAANPSSQEVAKEEKSNQVQSLHLPLSLLPPSPSLGAAKKKSLAKGKKAQKEKPPLPCGPHAGRAVKESDGKAGRKERGKKSANSEGPVQTLPELAASQVQSLHSTRESSLNHENHKNRVAAARLFAKGKTGLAKAKSDATKPLEMNQTKPRPSAAASGTGIGKDHEEAIRLLVDNVSDISASEARKLVGIAFSPERKRDLAYLMRLVEYVTTCERIRTPAAVLTTLIQTDQDRTPTTRSNGKDINRDRSRNNNGQNKSKSRGKSKDFGLSEYTYPTDWEISISQSNFMATGKETPEAGISVPKVSGSADATFETLVNSNVRLDTYQIHNDMRRGKDHLVGDAIWEIVQEDLAYRYRLEDATLKLLEGSRLEAEGQKVRVVLSSIWQERELGLVARSAIGLALRQRLGLGYDPLFVTV